MRRREIYSFGALAVVVFLTLFFPDSDEDKDVFSKTVKVSLREAGNQLLLSNQDSTTLILPVIELEPSKFELSFQHGLSFEPGGLVSVMKTSFQKSGLPEHYIVEVIQCQGGEVAYSYEMTANEQTTIIPCFGRILPEGCYTIEVNFTDREASLFSGNTLLYLLILAAFGLLFFQFYSRKQALKTELVGEVHHADSSQNYLSIGSFQFYPEQNKLVKAAIEISLSRKECEILAIFIASPNQVIKRDELTKKVWEDNGVIVGRSLDTYISKIRKKLSPDESIKLTNVHGVGYKLELMS